MKTSSVEFISRSPNPLPMNSKHHRFVLLRRIFQPWQWKRRKREIVLNRRPELYRGKYRCVQPKINLLKKMFLCRSPWKYRCGQRTVRMAVVACSQNFAQAQQTKTKTFLDIRTERAERERRTREVREQALPSEYHSNLSVKTLFN
ncbi:hypothetical protein TNCV_4018471 [Trichonephila clavipes]|nr:hypothetical protein TNCV_4018471 [Trichonephila clavipes]